MKDQGINWFSKADGDLLEIALPDESDAIVVLIDSTRCNAKACLLSHQSQRMLEESENSRIAWLRESELRLDESTEFRIVSRKVEGISLAKSLVAHGLREGKRVLLTDKGEAVVQFIPSESRIRIQRSVEEAKTRVLVIDDSETIRKLLSKIIEQDPKMECVGAVASPSVAIEAIKRLAPDVITLDIHMPEMNGVELLKKYLPLYPIPTVMISALSREDGTFVLDALEAGAVDYIQKPSMAETLTQAPLIREKIKFAKFAKVRAVESGSRSQALRTLSSDGVDFSNLIVIGASTGGTEALKEVLTRLPEKIPPILIVQHIPPVFSKAFADRMNDLCPFEVREARHGDVVVPNQVLIAPGGIHMRVRASADKLIVSLDDTPHVNRHKPSVDALFDSVAGLKRKKVVAAILTGMGSDGARGMLNLKSAGATTFAQNEATCVVFGMPREAMKLDAVSKMVPLGEVAEYLLKACRNVQARNKAS